MNLVLPEGARKLGGGGDAVEGVHLYMPCCAPPLCWHLSASIRAFFFTYDTSCNLLVGICNHQRKRVWLRGRGGGAIAARGVAFHMPWGGGGGGGGAAGPHPQGYA